MTSFGKIFSTLVILTAAILSSPASAAEDLKLHQINQVNAISFEPGSPDKFLIGTFSGVFSVTIDGSTKHISPDAGGITELIRHPQNPQVLLASGYRTNDKKLGILRSEDGGKTWQQISKGGAEEIAFHAMAYAASDPSIIYATGIESNIHSSRDGGVSWNLVGPTPELVYDLAVSRTNPDLVFLASRAGLFKSPNGGKDWSSAHSERRPTTMVAQTQEGNIWAFIYGFGLVNSSNKGALLWQKSAVDFADRAIMNMAINPANTTQMLAIMDTGAVLISNDSAKSWKNTEGQAYASAERIAAGAVLFDDNCAGCHGENGVGEFPEDMYKKDENGLFAAPAMDDSAHAWHHPDGQLIETILNGSPRNERMLAWKETGITRQNAESLVAYIKSLWSIRSISCQGQRHMSCMR